MSIFDILVQDEGLDCKDVNHIEDDLTQCGVIRYLVSDSRQVDIVV